jgi:hypothetical protein
MSDTANGDSPSGAPTSGAPTSGVSASGAPMPDAPQTERTQTDQAQPDQSGGDWARPDWPAGWDPEQPSAARVYDYYLGGSHNFAVDRDLAEQVLATDPRTRDYAQSNRDFLRRAVRYLVSVGIRQFLDLGSGLPTVGNVHEVALRDAPDARIGYVDLEPVAVAHARRLLRGNDQVQAVRGDLRHPELVLTDPQLRSLIDLTRPVAMLMVAVLHFVPDTTIPGGVPGLIARWRDQMAPDSYLVISHAAPPTDPAQQVRAAQVINAYQQAGTTLVLRDQQQVTDLFDGFEIVDPGIVEVEQWHPDPHSLAGRRPPSPGYCGIGKLAPSSGERQ